MGKKQKARRGSGMIDFRAKSVAFTRYWFGSISLCGIDLTAGDDWLSKSGFGGEALCPSFLYLVKSRKVSSIIELMTIF